ncbi:MAG: amino acid ABC transporter substrate-binding protein [Candidatus Velthaea sp.]
MSRRRPSEMLGRRVSRAALAAAAAVTLAIPAAPVSADDATIVFGAAVAATGRDAREGALTKEGYEFWKDYVNAHGGIPVGGKRYRVDIRYADDESNPQTAARLVEKFIDQDHVNFMLAPYGSADTFSAAAVVERKKIPMVEGNGASERIFNQGNKYTFGVLSPGRKYLQGVLDMAVHMKPRPQTIAVVSANDLFSIEAAAGAIEFANAHGLKVVYTTRYPADTTDVSSVVTALKATNPDIVVNGGRLQEALMMQRALKEQNVNAKIFAHSVGPDTPDFRQTLGKDANYVFGGTQWSSSAKYRGAPGFVQDSKTYAAEFAKKYGHVPSYQNAESSATCLAFQYALAKAGTLDPARVRDALAALDVVTFFGLLKFDERGMNIFKPMVVNQIQNGESVTVWPMGSQVKRPLYPTPPWNAR